MGRKRRLTSVQNGFDEWKKLESQIKTFGLEIEDVKGDGNCCFRALSLHSDISCETLRASIVNYIMENKDEFEPFTESNFEKYCINMSRDGTYGGNLELYAYAIKYKVVVVVHQLNAPLIIIKDENPTAVGIIHVAYVSWQHYSGIRVPPSTCNSKYCNLVGQCGTKKTHKYNSQTAIKKALLHFLELSKCLAVMT